MAPTVAELTSDAWQELSGYDGRIARTVRMLVVRPGALMVETLEGWFTYAIPLGYFLVIVCGIFPKGVGLEIPWPQVVALAALGTVLLMLAVACSQ